MEILRRANPRATEYAKQAGIELNSDSHNTISKLAWITQMPKEFDFESSHWSSTLHQTGPFLDAAGRVKEDFPWEQITGQPIIYASMGTLQNSVASPALPRESPTRKPDWLCHSKI
jgi:zeaxanthin glucosyltransferase